MEVDHNLQLSLPVQSEEQHLQDVADMGPIDLLRRALKMLKENVAVFMWIQFTLVVPLTICCFLVATTPFILLPMLASPLLFIGLLTVLALIMLKLGHIVVGAILYTVESLYDGKTITITEVFRAIPTLRNAITGRGMLTTFPLTGTGKLVSIPLIIILGTIFSLAFECLMHFSNIRGDDSIPFSGLLKIELFVFFLGFGVILPYLFYQMNLSLMAQCVTFFEGTQGLEAIKKGWSLLKGKWKVAVGLSATLDLSQIVAGFLMAFPIVSYRLDKKELHMKVWLSSVFLVIVMAKMFQITLMTRALFYISCKAYHHEGFDMDSRHQLGTGYEPIAKSELRDTDASTVQSPATC